MRHLLLNVFVLFLLTCTGCARYGFDVVQPPDVGRRVVERQWTAVPYEPLRYELTAAEGRLVVRIVNPTDQPISLLGHASFVVSPRGESHPMTSQTIAPGSYIRLILPPPRPTASESGPRIGIGFGTVIGSGAPYRRGYYPYRGYYGPGFGSSFAYDEPRYYTVYDPADNRYWTWDGETDARVSLTYQRGQEQFTHGFVFARRKI
jgi:hypothetical protein